MPNSKKLRIAYLSGPSDAVSIYSEWSERRKQGYFGTNYMKLFFQLCANLNAEAYIITTLPGEYSFWRKDGFSIENRPLAPQRMGLSYHFAMVKWFARLAPKLLQFKPDVLIATANQTHWFLLFYLRWFGIPILPSFHSLLWAKFAPVRRSWRILWQLNRFLILRHVKVALVASKDIAEQLRSLIGTTELEIVEHLPSYPTSQFASIPSPNSVPRPPFRVFFAGRIETNKGVYIIVELARRLNAERHGMVEFDICGEGGELNNLRQRVDDLKLKDVVRCHGYLDASKLSAVLAASHAVIVPTTSELEEGFNMVCAEAILANRPVITSAVCPALAYIREAAVEVQPDNIDEYQRAIISLSDNAEFYKQRQEACAALQKQFYDPKNSWIEKVAMLLNAQILLRS